MVPVNRAPKIANFKAMMQRARKELAAGRQIVIFPEGTRRPAGAEPSYKYGIARLYAEANVPVLPVALNSGVFWRRRSMLREPGTVVAQVLDPIPPGLGEEEFMARLQNDIETATTRLIDEASRSA
jgi:1-acyl-sn-glycerol-3-phosphate acyltransferase